MSEILKSRREFFQWMLATGGVVSTLSLTGAWAADSSLPAGKTAVSESDPTAKQLGYVADAAKVDLKKYPQKKTPEGKKQKCENCMFYTKLNDQWGNCQVIQGGAVAAKGWCMSWAKKS